MTQLTETMPSVEFELYDLMVVIYQPRKAPEDSGSSEESQGMGFAPTCTTA